MNWVLIVSDLEVLGTQNPAHDEGKKIFGEKFIAPFPLRNYLFLLLISTSTMNAIHMTMEEKATTVLRIEQREATKDVRIMDGTEIRTETPIEFGIVDNNMTEKKTEIITPTARISRKETDIEVTDAEATIIEIDRVQMTGAITEKITATKNDIEETMAIDIL